tara:strand:+ start:1777 stop:2487 length:711 start_codon:yes stop_codon:yes gene_type:complete
MTKNNISKFKQIKSKLLILSLLVFVSANSTAYKQVNESIRNKTPKVAVLNEDTTLDTDIIKGFKNIIYKVYPKLVKDFNKNARMDLTIKIDTAYDGVAYANDGRITVSSQWLHKKPEDLDLMTHEIMHIIQSYPNGSGPGWLTEGIADYVRYKYGLNNKKADWSLPEFSENQNYKNSYRITARFLLWITQKYDKKIVNKLDSHLRSKTYTPELWREYTGFDVDQLWKNYSENPKLK